MSSQRRHKIKNRLGVLDGESHTFSPYELQADFYL